MHRGKKHRQEVLPEWSHGAMNQVEVAAAVGAVPLRATAVAHDFIRIQEN